MIAEAIGPPIPLRISPSATCRPERPTLVVETVAWVAGQQPGQRVEAADDRDRGQPDWGENPPVAPVEAARGEQQLAEGAAAAQIAEVKRPPARAPGNQPDQQQQQRDWCRRTPPRPLAPVLDVDGSLVEGRVRARRRIGDRVRALLLHLAVGPVGLLAAAVLEEADFAWPFSQRLGRVRCLEDDLHPLPIALVQVVELIEVPEEPVLDGESGRPASRAICA